MEQLSSCYFCGDALDASLDEHPVVPASLHPSADDQKTVVLCGACKRKLDAVMDAVVGAMDGSSTVDSPRDATGTDSRSDSVSEIESTLGDDEDVLRSVGDDNGERSAGGSAETSDVTESEMEWGGDQGATESSGADADGAAGDESDDEGSDDEKERKYTSSRRAGYTGETKRSGYSTVRDSKDDDSSSGSSSGGSESSGSSSGGSASGGSSSTDSASGDSSDGGQTGGSTDGERAEDRTASGGGTDEGTGQRDTGGRSGGTESSESGSESGRSGDDEATPDVSLTRLENTKVMRLLQNRKFPVEREDFVTVASSAYEVSPDDCDKVIELAIDHDLLREDGGQLYAGARWD